MPRTARVLGRWLVLGLIGPGLCPAQTRPAGRSLQIAVDPRVELFSILFRLAGNPEYNQGEIQSYVKDVEARFGKYRMHPAVSMARELARTRGVAFDAPMMLAVHVRDGYSLEEAVAFDPRPESLDARWQVAAAREFLDKARDFVRDADFPAFIRRHEALHALAVARAQELIRAQGHLEWFDDFFGTRAHASFRVALGLLNDGASYGPHCRTADGREEYFCILGVWATDAKGMPVFNADALPVVIHEFCHSYANPVVERHMESLRSAGQRLFPFVADGMRQQAYGQWKSMMYESLVRACVVRHTLRYGGKAAAEKAIEEERQRHFLWIEELSNVLGEYEAHRSRHATLDAFMPRIAAVLNDYADDLERASEKKSGREPRIASTTPANEATNVDPDLAAIRIVFDRPMKDGPWKLHGGGPHFPEITGPPTYNATRRTLTVPVRLKPLWSYEFRLNADGDDGIRSETGVPLPPACVTFRTGEGRGWRKEDDAPP